MSSAFSIPPSPTIGMRITPFASYTSLSVIGLMAGPDNPPLVLPILDILVWAFRHIAGYVLAMTTASAPSRSQAWAIRPITPTLGDSFTQRGLTLAAARADRP